jgi:hypothetical protein
MLDTSTAGMFTTTYSLNFSGEKLPGATALAGLTLKLSGIVDAAASESADFDSDGDVDGEDFLTWQRGLGVDAGATRSDGDASSDQLVNDKDLAVWRSQFGSASSTALPEPASCVYVFISLAVTAAFRRSKGANISPA